LFCFRNFGNITGFKGKFCANCKDAASFSSDVLYEDPERFYKSSLKLLEFLYSIKNAKPNKAHLILAKMESLGYISSIITQNIDGLHTKAGSKKVYEVHGNLEEGCYTSCGSKVTFDLLIEKILNNELPPRCTKCSGVLRPNIILFGDLWDITVYVLDNLKSPKDAMDFIDTLDKSILRLKQYLTPASYISHKNHLR